MPEEELVENSPDILLVCKLGLAYIRWETQI